MYNFKGKHHALCYCRCINTIYVVICITDQATVKTCVEMRLICHIMIDGTNSRRNGLFKIKCVSFLIVIRYFFFKGPGAFILDSSVRGMNDINR